MKSDDKILLVGIFIIIICGGISGFYGFKPDDMLTLNGIGSFMLKAELGGVIGLIIAVTLLFIYKYATGGFENGSCKKRNKPSCKRVC